MIINSLLDTDLYKFTLMQVVLHQFPGTQVEYKFKCRNPGLDPATGQAQHNLALHVEEIRREIRSLCNLHFAEAELAYLRSLRFIKNDFVDFLVLFTLDEKYISVTALPSGEIDVTIRGPWLHTILFEVPVLAIIDEVYFRNAQSPLDLNVGRKRLDVKIAQLQASGLQNLKIADYGTRRRYSRDWHEEVLRVLADGLGTSQRPGQSPGREGQLAGTSNVWMAMTLGLTPLGTMSNEFLEACQALAPRLRDSQSYAFESWVREYRGDVGIALSDVYGMNAFLRDFDLFFCKLFDGVRHESGDPLLWGERMLDHYRRNRVDPRTKTLVFSDALTVQRVIEIQKQFEGRCQLAFGIGTNLTNDLGDPPGHVPLQIAIKMVHCNGQPVAKLSDTPSLRMCDDEKYLTHLCQVFDIPQTA